MFDLHGLLLYEQTEHLLLKKYKTKTEMEPWAYLLSLIVCNDLISYHVQFLGNTILIASYLKS